MKNLDFYYCTVKAFDHPKKVLGTNSIEFQKTTIEVGTHFDHWRKIINIELPSFINIATSGHSVIASIFDGDRIEDKDRNTTGEGFVYSKFILIDSDSGKHIDELKELLEQEGLILNAYYHSYSSKPDALRYRLIITLDNAITCLEQRKTICSYLIDLLDADPACKDSLHIFYPGRNGSVLSTEPNSLSRLTELALKHAEIKNERISIAKQTSREMLNSDALRLLIAFAHELDASHPWRRLVCDNEWLYNDDGLFYILSSMPYIEGGLDYMEDYVKSKPYTRTELQQKLSLIRNRLSNYAYPPMMFPNNEKPNQGINGYSLYALGRMLISQKEGLGDRWGNSNADNSVSSNTASKKTPHPSHINTLVDSDTENGRLIDIYKSPKNGIRNCTDYTQQGMQLLENAKKEEIENKASEDDKTSQSPPILPQKRIDDDGNLYSTLTDGELKKRLETIVTSREAEYEILTGIELFERFVNGDRLDGIGTEEFNSELPEHKALVYGLAALCQYIKLPSGERVKFSKFLNDIAFSHDFYDRKKRSKKTLLMPKLLKEVDKMKASNKKRFGINKVIPKSYHNGRCQTNICLEYKELKQLEQDFLEDDVKEYKYNTLEENRAWLQKKTLLDQETGKVRVIKGDTGLGKSVLLLKWLLEAISCGLAHEIAVAVPKHELMAEVKQRWIEEGLIYGQDFVCTPSTDILPVYIKEKIEPYYRLGLFRKVTELLKRHNNVPEVQKYLDQNAIANKFNGIVLTTHTKVINSISSDYFSNTKYIIFDECPSDNLIDQADIKLKEINAIIAYLIAIKSKCDDGTFETEFSQLSLFTLDSLKQLRDACNKLLDQQATNAVMGQKFKPCYTALNLDIYCDETLNVAINELSKKLTSKLTNLLDKKQVLYSGTDDEFLLGRLKPVDIEEKHITILSATPFMPIIEACFEKENVNLEETNLTKNKGQIFWVDTNSTSRSKMREQNIKGVISNEWKQRLDQINSHTIAICKEFKKEAQRLKSKHTSIVLTYPCEGSNAVKGKSLTACGKYLESPQSLLMKALLIGAKPTTIARQNASLTTIDYIDHSGYTFVDETLRELDQLAYEKCMLQTVGRTRLLEYASTVFIISDRAIPQSQKISWEQFTKIVHISIEGDAITLNYQLTGEEKILFEDKLLGLRNESNELTDYGQKLTKEFDGNRQELLKYLIESGLDYQNTNSGVTDEQKYNYESKNNRVNSQASTI